MEFFSNSKPDLVGPKVRKSVYKIMKTDIDNTTISDRISSMMTNFYKDYISEYKLFFFFVVAMVVFLLYRYYTKERKAKTGEDRQEKFTVEEQKIMDNIMNTQTAHLKLDTQPSFNPLKPVNDQHEDVNYPPDPLAVNLPDKGLIYTKNLYGDYPPQFDNLNKPNYDYNTVYTSPNRSYYSGTHNPYENAQDTNIINPYGWSNRFNTDTGAFINSIIVIIWFV
jgi:large-conductance mechanosensitive channel